MGAKYRPPAGPESNPEFVEIKKEYIPPVGPGSKSVPPSGDFRSLPAELLPNIESIKE